MALIQLTTSATEQEMRTTQNSNNNYLNSKVGTITLSVLDYGAKNDGVTDNLTAFHSICDYVNSTDGNFSVFFPDGKYAYSGGFSFTKSIKLYSNGGAELVYTGTDKAVSFSVYYNSDGTPKNGYYQPVTVENITFRNGQNMTHGLFFGSYLTAVRMKGVKFKNFGNANAYDVWLSKNNWDTVMEDCSFYSDDTEGVIVRNWVRCSGDCMDSADQNAGFNSNFRMLGCLGSDIGTSSHGVGVWLDGINNKVSHSKIEGFNPDIRLGVYSNYNTICNNYFEGMGNAIIEYGESGYNESSYITNLICEGNFANVHNTDSFAASTYFVAPTTANSGISNSIFKNNSVMGSSTREMVNQNNKSAGGLIAQDNYGWAVFHTTGTNISNWAGNQGDIYNFIIPTDNSNFIGIKAGKTATQYTGISLINFDGTVLDVIQTSSNGMLEFIHRSQTALQIDQYLTAHFPGRVKTDLQYVIGGQTQATLAWNNSIFIDSADGILKFRDSGGTVHALY